MDEFVKSYRIAMTQDDCGSDRLVNKTSCSNQIVRVIAYVRRWISNI